MTTRKAFRPVSLGLVAAGLVLGGWRVGAAIGDDPEPKSTGPETTIERPLYDPELTTKTVDFWKQRADRDPQGAIARANLASAYLARQRETGRIEDAVHAETAARDSLEVRSRGNASALKDLARALLGQHRFPEALAVADRALALDPDAERLRADILLELGEYEPARKALAAIPDEPDDLNLMALRSRFAELDGDNDRAIALLRDAGLLADKLPDMPVESVAWYHTMVGHRLIDSGRLDQGEAACRQALAIFPRDYRAMTGLAEAASWRKDWPGAASWARKADETSPQNPEALRLLGEAREAMGDPAGAEDAFNRLHALYHSFPRIYDRHWAVFCADRGRDLDEAMRIARADLELRHDVHARDTLAWVCFKKGLVNEADDQMKQALAVGMADAPMLHHAALIARASGDRERADALAKRVRTLNPYLEEESGLEGESGSP